MKGVVPDEVIGRTAMLLISGQPLFKISRLPPPWFPKDNQQQCRRIENFPGTDYQSRTDASALFFRQRSESIVAGKFEAKDAG